MCIGPRPPRPNSHPLITPEGGGHHLKKRGERRGQKKSVSSASSSIFWPYCSIHLLPFHCGRFLQSRRVVPFLFLLAHLFLLLLLLLIFLDEHLSCFFLQRVAKMSGVKDVRLFFGALQEQERRDEHNLFSNPIPLLVRRGGAKISLPLFLNGKQGATTRPLSSLFHINACALKWLPFPKSAVVVV